MNDMKEMLVALGAVKRGSFVLASGRKSDYYVDMKSACTDIAFLRLVAAEAKALVRGADRLAGIELGAVPPLVATAMETGIPFIIVRKERKAHGTGAQIEGVLHKGEHVVFIEDVTTTGNSLVRGIEVVRSLGGIVEEAIVLVDREEGAQEHLAEIGVSLHPLVRISEIWR
ncbi:MAG: orotate phosphoribosyltransferase [Candidatus Thermoplasmatota archaeon]